MLIGLLILLAPGAVFIFTLPLSGRLRPILRMVYRILGGLVVFFGSGISLYFASYSGDQGGIAAFYFQIAVILVYAAVASFLVTLNWILCARESRKNET